MGGTNTFLKLKHFSFRSKKWLADILYPLDIPEVDFTISSLFAVSYRQFPLVCRLSRRPVFLLHVPILFPQSLYGIVVSMTTMNRIDSIQRLHKSRFFVCLVCRQYQQCPLHI